jgi:hypothetical protein
MNKFIRKTTSQFASILALFASTLVLMIISSESWAASNCTPGSFGDDGSSMCTPAPPGFYVDIAGATSPTECAPGSYSANAGQTACTLAPAGSYVIVAGMTAAELCPAGEFSDSEGSVTCTQAPMGSYVGTPGQTSATSCEKGTYSDRFGAYFCEPAPEGSFVDTIGAVSATECAPGSYTDTPGLEACVQAPPGTFSANPGTVSPRLCPLGSYSKAFGNTACTLAPIGSFVPTVGATAANFCLLGTVTRALGASACVAAIYGQLNLDNTSYTLSENTQAVTLTVNRTNGSDGQVSVDYSLQDGTAVATQDYIYAAGTLTFLNGETIKTINVSPVDNTVFSAEKYLTITLNNAMAETKSKGILGVTSTAKIFIANDDAAPAAGTIGLELLSQEVQENTTSVFIDVVRSGGTAGPVSVTYATQDNTAVSGQKYEAVAGVLRFAAGETRKTLSVRVINTDAYEKPKTFTLKLSNPQGGALLANTSSDITIIDKKPSTESASFNIETSQYVVNENDNTVTVNINRVGTSDGEASVDVSLQGFASLIDGTLRTIRFGSGETQKIITYTLTDNQIFQGDQTFTLALSNPLGANLGSQASVMLKLLDDEAAPAAGVLHLSGSAYVFNENASKLPITITRSNGSLGEVKVNLTTKDGTAFAKQDYLAVDTLVTFANGEMSKTLNLVVTDDSKYTGARSFTIELSNISGGAFLAGPNSATVTIDEDEPTPPAGIFQFANPNYSVKEADKTLTLTILRTSGSLGNASVDYKTMDNTALSGQDLSSSKGTLFFSEGEISKTLVLDILDDKVIETTELFSVILSNPTEAILGIPSKTEISIIDNDTASSEAPPKTSKSKGGVVSLWILLLGSLSLIWHMSRTKRQKF